MARANTIQTNFTSGEISPHLYGRVDVTKYFNGVRKLKNHIVFPQGGIVRRPGSQFLGETRDADSDGNTNYAVLRKFVFSNTQAYTLEFTNLKIRFWNRNGRIENPPGTPVEVTTTYAEADLPYLCIAQSADVLYITCPGYPPKKLSRFSDTSWTFALVSFNDGPYLDADTTGNPVRIKGTSTDTNISDVATFQATGAGFVVGDVNKFIEFKDPEDGKTWKLGKITAFIGGNTVQGQVLTNILLPNEAAKITFNSPQVVSSLSGVFTPNDTGKYIRLTVNPALSNNDPAPDGSGTWYLTDGFVDSDHMRVVTPAVVMKTYAHPTVVVEVQSRTILGRLTSGVALFAAGDVGRTMRLRYGTTWRIATIASFTSSTEVGATFNDYPVLDPKNNLLFYNAGIANEWRWNAWGTVSGYPAICGFHGGRLWFGRTPTKPTTLWGSESDDYESMSPSDLETGAVTESNAITVTIANSEVNPINWIKSGPVMLIGTEGGELQLRANNVNAAISPTNVVVTGQTSFGSTSTQENSCRTGSQTLFTQIGGLKVREMAYDFNIDAFVSRDILVLSEHIFRGAFPNASDGNPLTGVQGIVSMDIGRNPITIGWFVLANGKFVGMTYDRDQDIIAFHNHEIGGGGSVESICVTPDPIAGTDIVWLSVKRTVNGFVKRYIEIFNTIHVYDLAQSLPAINPPHYVDCWKRNLSQTGSVDGSTGWDHFGAGSVVQVLIDGIYIGEKTIIVTSNPIGVGFQLKYLVNSVVVAGFKMPSIVGLLDPEGGSQAGNSQAKRKRVSESAIRVLSSVVPKIASAQGNTDETMSVINNVDPVEADWKNIVPSHIIAAPGSSPPYPVPAAAPPTAYTGDVTFATDDAFDNGGRIEIIQNEPYHLKIVSVMHKLNTND